MRTQRRTISSDTTPPTSIPAPRPEPHRVRLERDHEAAVGAREHHALEPDVQHAGLLGDHLAEAGEEERHGRQHAARHEGGQEGLGEQVFHVGYPTTPGWAGRVSSGDAACTPTVSARPGVR